MQYYAVKQVGNWSREEVEARRAVVRLLRVIEGRR